MENKHCEECGCEDKAICKMCIYRHPIITKLYEAIQEIESGGANEHLTTAQTLIGEVQKMFDEYNIKNAELEMDKDFSRRLSGGIKQQLRLFYINCQSSGDFEMHLNIAALKLVEVFEKIQKEMKDKTERQ